jgi:hypothetical protein
MKLYVSETETEQFLHVLSYNKVIDPSAYEDFTKEESKAEAEIAQRLLEMETQEINLDDLNMKELDNDLSDTKDQIK